MLFSSLVILLKVLKRIRLQDTVGETPQVQSLLAVACLAAANQCDKNICGRPLFMKNLKKATFVAMNFAEVSQAYNRPTDYIGLQTYEDWNSEYSDLLIQIYHAVLQTCDLNVEVIYPVLHVAQAIPADHAARAVTLGACRRLLLDERWDEFAEKSLYQHPRTLAFELFEASLAYLPQDREYTAAAKHAIMQSILDINTAEVSQAL